MGLKVLRGSPRLDKVQTVLVVGGSTRTSTIPGISIAGPSPEGTLYTPTLDLEYLMAGRPITLPVIPVSPEGLPTPAVITRALHGRVRAAVVPVDSGMAYPPRVPHARLPSSTVGGRLGEEPGLPQGTARKILEDSQLLGRTLARGHRGIMIGETIPGGTTTAAAIMEALAGGGVELVSSSSASNPKDLKARVVTRAVEAASRCRDPYCKLDMVGDPVHVAIAGIAAGALDEGAEVILAGGTQMGAVLAILDTLWGKASRVTVATTKWILEDQSSDIEAIVDRHGAGLVVAEISFSDAPWEGLRMYDKGYVKEGVAAGGMMALALAQGLGDREIKEAVYREYGRLLQSGSTG